MSGKVILYINIIDWSDYRLGLKNLIWKFIRILRKFKRFSLKIIKIIKIINIRVKLKYWIYYLILLVSNTMYEIGKVYENMTINT